MTQDQRAAFEAWAKWYALPLGRVVSDERYESMETEAASKAWQAAIAHMQKPSTEAQIELPPLPEWAYDPDLIQSEVESALHDYARQAISHARPFIIEQFLNESGQYVTNAVTRQAAIDDAIAHDRQQRSDQNIHDLATELWAAAQTPPGESVIDAESRIVEILARQLRGEPWGWTVLGVERFRTWTWTGPEAERSAKTNAKALGEGFRAAPLFLDRAPQPAEPTEQRGEPVAWRIRHRSEPGMIGHYPWSYTDRIRGRRDDTHYEYEPLFAAPQPAEPTIRNFRTVAEPVKVPSNDVAAHIAHINWWADAYDREGGHAVITGLLREYAALLSRYQNAQPAVPDAICLGCARMGLAGASDEEVLNYVRIATGRPPEGE